MDEPNPAVVNRIIRDIDSRSISLFFLILHLLTMGPCMDKVRSITLENKEPVRFPSFEPMMPGVFVVFVANEQCASFNTSRAMTFNELLKRQGG